MVKTNSKSNKTGSVANKNCNIENLVWNQAVLGEVAKNNTLSTRQLSDVMWVSYTDYSKTWYKWLPCKIQPLHELISNENNCLQFCEKTFTEIAIHIFQNNYKFKPDEYVFLHWYCQSTKLFLLVLHKS